MRSLILLGVFVVTCLIPGCDFPESPQTVTVSNPPPMRPSKPSDIKTLQEAMATIMTITREDLHFPVVDPVEVLLYKNTASFASYGQGWRALPIDMDNISAFTRSGKIHINVGKTQGKKWGTLIDLLAHEYGHSIYTVLNNRRTANWFSEGFASWIAARVLHSLGWQDYALALERAKLELISNHDNLLGLSDLDWQWQALSERPNGYIETYVLAFFATARLIDQQGLPATMEYIKSGDFKKSFHMSYETFTAEFAVHLSSLMPSIKADTAVMQKPEWKIGDQWTYTVKHPGDEPLTTKTIVREDRFDGKASYVIRSENRELFHSKDTLERLAALKEGTLTSQRYGASHDFSWPLILGKRWSNSYSWEDFVTKDKHKTDHSMIVSEIGNVTVPAGTFLAARVQGYDSRTGRLMTEYWYSPTTKWFVKLRNYSDIAFSDNELTSFKIK
jgi:hypothetical protein